MTRERVEPGIWRRGEVFEITWRDAQGKQRRKTVQGGITAARKALTDADVANAREAYEPCERPSARAGTPRPKAWTVYPRRSFEEDASTEDDKCSCRDETARPSAPAFGRIASVSPPPSRRPLGTTRERLAQRPPDACSRRRAGGSVERSPPRQCAAVAACRNSRGLCGDAGDNPCRRQGDEVVARWSKGAAACWLRTTMVTSGSMDARRRRCCRVAQLRRGALRAGAAVDRMYNRPCPGGYTAVGGAGVQYEGRVADGATRATKNGDTPCTTWTSFERN
jgi:hypothetical protein